MKRFVKTMLLAAAAAGVLATSSLASELVIGTKSELAMDPHFLWSDANTSFYVQMYGSLVNTDEKVQIVPGLAEKWGNVSEKEWQFTLFKGLKFHDGSPLTSEDVVASFNRAKNLPNAAAPYSGAIAAISEITAIDELTVSFKTHKPDPTVPYQVAQIQIIPSEVAASFTTDDFNTGRAVIGAGAYKLKSYQAGSKLILERNFEYAGKTPKWDKVTFRFIPDDAARVAGLLGGDLDLIDFVGPSFVDRLRNDKKFNVATGPSDRVIYLIPDTERDVSPFISDKDGNPLKKNPFKDKRVREAMTIAIDRDAITDKVMNGLAFPAAQLAPEGFGGFDASIFVPKTDIKRAKQLLSDAGYPDGFRVTLHCTNDRYVNDAKICLTVGQMYARIGIQVDVQTMPKSVFFPKAVEHDGKRFSLSMLGWGSSTSGEAGALAHCIHSYDKANGLGTWNLGHYSNLEADKIIEESKGTMSVDKRHALLREAMRLVMEDFAVIPLHYQSVVVATKKDINYTTWATERTIADSAILVKN